METVISSYVEIAGMNNTRDLGGMRTKDGRRIRSGMLYRSARLEKLQDPDWFTRNVDIVVDMRSSQEVKETPDPEIPGVENLHLPIFEMQASAVTRDEESERRMMAPPPDPETALQNMAAVYTRFVTDEFCLSQYRRFIELLFKPREKAILWHCTAGKDRTGTGALFIQEILGVDREAIMADYLITNEYLKEEIAGFVEMIAKQSGKEMTETEKEAMLAFMGAHERYPQAVWAAAEENYGTFDDFIRDGLCINDFEREELKNKYLE